MFKIDSLFEGTHTVYGNRQNVPTVVRLVGTGVSTVAGDASASGTITEKVPVLREVSMPMHLDELISGYAKFEVAKPGLRPLV